MKKTLILPNRQKVTGLVATLCTLAAGILLLARPVLMMDLAVWLLSGGLIVLGLYWLIRYFRATPQEGALSYDFAEALIALALGASFLLSRGLFDALLPKLWGALLILGGIMILQSAVDFLRMRYGKWWILLIGSAIALALGAFALLTPPFLTDYLALFVGVSLIFEGAVNLVTLILLHLYEKGWAEKERQVRTAKKNQKAADRAVAEAAEALDPNDVLKETKPAPAAAAEEAKPTPQEPAQASAAPEEAKPTKPAPATIFEELAQMQAKEQAQGKEEA